MKLGLLRPTINELHANENIFHISLRVFNEDIEVAVFVEDARVQEFIFGSPFAPTTVLLYKLPVREFPLRILVEIFHVGMRWCGVQIKVVFLDILTVIALRARQTEDAFL